MARQVELPENVYDALMRAAAEEGQSAVEWIAARVAPSAEPIVEASKNGEGQDSAERFLLERMEGSIGVLDSREEPYPHRPTTAFGEGVAEKLARQGIRRPW